MNECAVEFHGQQLEQVRQFFEILEVSWRGMGGSMVKLIGTPIQA